jgi:hypothetical protein
MDLVKVIDLGYVYPSYTDWVKHFQPAELENYVEFSDPDPDKTYRVIFTAAHLLTKEEILHLIKDRNTGQVFVIAQDGITSVFESAWAIY